MNTNTCYTLPVNGPDQNFTCPSESAAAFELHHETPEYQLCNPVLNSLLEDVCARGSYVIDPISSHICTLQEVFLNELYSALERAEIDLSEKMTVYRNTEGKLTLLGDHPQKTDIEAALAKIPYLSDVFCTLSSHSEIARDIVNINRIFSSLNNEDELAHDNASGYHLSLKGGMSHFYFM